MSRVEQVLQKIRSTRSSTLTVEQLELELFYACLCNALPKEYESFHSAVLLLSDFTWSTLKEAFAQEQQNRQEHVQITQAMLASGPSTPSSSRSVICTFCNVSGHTEDKCFRKERAARQAKADAQNAASRRGRGRKGQKAHVAQEEESAEFAGNASALDYTNPHSPLISDAGTDWIADTGATCHMIPNRH